MTILYIFPHPDDEAFGTAHVMWKQRREGHEVYLLTLTKGGATKMRFKYGYTPEQMCAVRYEELKKVAKTLDLSGFTVLDLPDSGLKEMDPREIEKVVRDEIEKVQPQIVVTYAVHGISGFHDHIVTHAAVKQVCCEMRETAQYLKRLAFLTLTEETAKRSPYYHLNGSTSDEIDCVVEVEQEDLDMLHKALDCYETFQETIEKSGIKQLVERKAVFEIFQEKHDPPLVGLFEKLK